ncbi:16S rRNA (cytidine(1402)-2'-O)-methyltransferase [Spirulina sp. 06S082]|uniref:16S rRNA (cytidine(1402)-2'-O)-methyltransferase n=1 Tax=Spirulina sp. 06S082 TaxID=3110248 RepID=UPI002B20E86D|nr:16S rRNA (cytidine(1402)-2'-O)-methyltransferase [Spirulina sp. 06S082]MEA5471886.1 16S rRNA (cytidine(1402)-2'-O)-methyltransferase [Spirulina sp. 06S082]
MLYLVGTPIGNLEDMTFRGVRILQEVDLIAAEDTRHTGKLLKHFQIQTPQISYHEHNKHKRLTELIQRLQSGEAIALVTDAGMPGISDPGYELVKACRENNLPVVPIPGVSAGITALVASGLQCDRFVFEGFLPTQAKAKGDRLTSLQAESRTLVLYEAPHRLLSLLQDLAATLGGDRPIVLARELTKLHEEFWQGSIKAAIAHYSQRPPKGEFTLVIAGISQNPTTLTETEIAAELQQLLEEGMSRSQASRHLAQSTDISRRHIYQIALSLPNSLENLEI